MQYFYIGKSIHQKISSAASPHALIKTSQLSTSFLASLQLCSPHSLLARLNVPGYWIVRAPFSSLYQLIYIFPFLIFSPLSFILDLLSSSCLIIKRPCTLLHSTTSSNPHYTSHNNASLQQGLLDPSYPYCHHLRPSGSCTSTR